MFNVFNRKEAVWGYYVVLVSLPVVLGMERMQQWRQRRRPRSAPLTPGASVAQIVLSLLAVAYDLPPLFSPQATAPRLFYFMLVYFFFHYNIVFRTAMTADLAKHPLQPGLQTHWDLLRFGFEVGTVSADPTVDLLLADASLEPLRDLHKDCEATACLRRLQGRSPKYGLLFSNTVMHYLMPLYFLDTAGMPYVERLPTPALSQFVSMYLRKGDPLARQMDDMFLRLIQAGLPDLWMARVSRANGRDKDGDGIPDDAGGGTQVLTLEHLVGAVLALILGQTLAVAAFLAEITAGLGAWVHRHLRVTVSWRPATAEAAADRSADGVLRRRRPAGRTRPGQDGLLLRTTPTTRPRVGGRAARTQGHKRMEP
ncbi:hypothetical protein ONE63_005700 [Megalurothrips usitatus]|uniref:Uncharacterized protein n=1 Tax=Megalurothrips usitatus TaxID=439358 RepID=A0AAV7Y0B0_9NEOP|nr:hypothetical protein ONE63_005700 [Megalurothrips usitatus]